jgi:hypothetical protein
MRDAVMRVALSGLGAALLLAPFAPAMRLASLRATSISWLGTALLLAPFSPAMRDAEARVALSRLEAALLLAAFAPAMRLAVRRVSSSLVRRATALNPLSAAIELTLPPAHGAPPGSRWSRPNPTADRHSHPSPTPLSALNDPLVHTTHTTVAVREQVKRCSMSRSRWSTALGRGTYGGCVVGQDEQGLLRSLHRQVRRLLARRCRFSKP